MFSPPPVDVPKPTIRRFEGGNAWSYHCNQGGWISNLTHVDFKSTSVSAKLRFPKESGTCRLLFEGGDVLLPPFNAASWR
jgi:hypothetical protein